MVVTWLAGSVVTSTYKWGYFVIGIFALFLLSINLLWFGRQYANAISPISPSVNRTYLIGACWIVSLWYLYPVCWGLSDGGNVIGSDGEMIFYGVLDLLTKPIWGAFILFSHRSIDIDTIGHAIRSYDEEIVIREKRGAGYVAPGGPTEGATTTPAMAPGEPAPQSV
jgi:bacteriorhodopsin